MIPLPFEYITKRASHCTRMSLSEFIGCRRRNKNVDCRRCNWKRFCVAVVRSAERIFIPLSHYSINNKSDRNQFPCFHVCRCSFRWKATKLLPFASNRGSQERRTTKKSGKNDEFKELEWNVAWLNPIWDASPLTSCELQRRAYNDIRNMEFLWYLQQLCIVIKLLKFYSLWDINP